MAASQHLRQAAAANDDKAALALARLYLDPACPLFDEAQALRMLRVASRKCRPDALLLHARCLLEGRGAPRDVPAAVRLLRSAVQNASSAAVGFVVGGGGQRGEASVGPDKGRCADKDAHRHVAHEGDAEARREAAWELGQLLCEGVEGVEGLEGGGGDTAGEGVRWLEYAASLGHAAAAQAAANAYRHGLGVAQNDLQAMHLEQVVV